MGLHYNRPTYYLKAQVTTGDRHISRQFPKTPALFSRHNTFHSPPLPTRLSLSLSLPWRRRRRPRAGSCSASSSCEASPSRWTPSRRPPPSSPASPTPRTTPSTSSSTSSTRSRVTNLSLSLSLSALPVVSSPIWLSFGARARACSAVVDSWPGRGAARGGAARRGGRGGGCGVSGGHQRALGAAGGGFVRRAKVPLRSDQESLLRVRRCRFFLSLYILLRISLFPFPALVLNCG